MSKESRPGGWFKVYCDIRTSSAFMGLPESVAYDYFLFLSLQADGLFDESVPEEMAWQLRSSADRLSVSMDALSEAGLLVDGEIVDPRGRPMTGDSSADRSRRWRAREKAKAGDWLSGDGADPLEFARQMAKDECYLERTDPQIVDRTVRLLLDEGEEGEINDLLGRLAKIPRWRRRRDDLGELVRAHKEGS